MRVLGDFDGDGKKDIIGFGDVNIRHEVDGKSLSLES